MPISFFFLSKVFPKSSYATGFQLWLERDKQLKLFNSLNQFQKLNWFASRSPALECNIGNFPAICDPRNRVVCSRNIAKLSKC